jgi:DNA-binding response OmpR family regulator
MATERRILIVDDEEKIAKMVASYLESSGFRTITAMDGLSGLRKFREFLPDLVVLDVNMPAMDGLEVAREIRKTSAVPIVFLSARTEETDRVVGLEIGADDYVPKPFSPRELVARIRAILRRTSPTSNTETTSGGVIRTGGIEMDPRKRTVLVNGMPHNLTTLQFDILLLLIREPGRVFDRSEILDAVAGTSFEGYERTIDAHIKNIRKALGDDGDQPRFIGTVRGVGYKFLEQLDATQK